MNGRWRVACALCLVYLFCTKVSDDNPVWSGYQGDYHLSVFWSSLPDTLEVFREYSVACSTGADTFSGFSGDGAIDSVLMLGSYREGSDSLTLYFISSFSGDFG
ncbi:MAG: hypothetical protein GF410_02615, partial [Chitinivibrionales bacterium]|nr:hypothetical protein [Chitinivibrionales bacterium]